MNNGHGNIVLLNCIQWMKPCLLKFVSALVNLFLLRRLATQPGLPRVFVVVIAIVVLFANAPVVAFVQQQSRKASVRVVVAEL